MGRPRAEPPALTTPPEPTAAERRIRQLTLLQGTTRLLHRDETDPIPVLLREIVHLLPGGFRWPERVTARIRLAGWETTGRHFQETEWTLRVPLRGPPGSEGAIEVALEGPPPAPPAFLPEEEALLTDLAQLVDAALGQRAVRQELLDAEARFRTLVENVSDNIVILDPDGTIRYESPSVRAMLGYAPEELVGTNAFDHVHPDDLQPLLRVILGRLDVPGPIPVPMSFRFRAKDGSWHQLEASGSNLLHEPGVAGIAVVARDVTELRRAEARYQEVFEETPVPLVVSHIETGVFIHVNPAFERLLGYPRNELLGHSSLDLGIWPDPEVRHRIAATVGAGRDVRDLATQVRCRSGELRWILYSGRPFHTEQGTLLASTVVDITARQEALAELQRTKERLEEAQEIAHVGSWEWLPGTDTALASRELFRLFGMPAREGPVPFRPFLDRVPPEDAVRFAWFADALAPGATIDEIVDHRVCLASGETRFARTRIRLLAKADGTPDRVVGTTADVTELGRAEENLRAAAEGLARANKDLEQFAYVASHDLREPLRQVASYVDLLAKHLEGQLDAQAHEYVAFAKEGAKRIQLLVQDLLTYTRAGNQPRPHVETDTSGALDEALADLQLALEESGAQLERPTAMPRVLGDPHELRQVFFNLLANAVKFRREEVTPRVRLGAEREEEAWHFTVADNGIGIDPAFRDRLFSRFARLETREAFPGTGMGLAIVKRIIEAHGGRAWVTSDGPGTGTTAHFTLPALPARAEGPAGPGSEEAP